MRVDAEEIYAAVLQRVAAVDHGWGKPYDFAAWYVLDHAVPAAEESAANLNGPPKPGYLFNEHQRVALHALSATLPALTFVHSFDEVYDAQRQGPVQIRNGGAFVALGPLLGARQRAGVGVMFYAGHHWARWMRYHLERADGAWRIVSREELAIS